MRLFDAVPAIIADLKDESQILSEKTAPTFEVAVARHPTLGRLVIVTAHEGSGVVIEVDESGGSR